MPPPEKCVLRVPDTNAHLSLFVIGQAGEDAVLLNSAGFEPREW
jgi:hypothetical protein